ncbi:MAG: leucyl aminopeptidase, partial [Eubacterium sp.]|nr:leucyl aminopeptidase [Eubacterium sp.]
MFEDNLKERYGLAIDRIAEIKENSEIEDAGLAAYFTYTAEFLLLVDKWNEKRKAGGYDKLPLEELQHWNTVLYEDIIGKQYDNSFANPSYACARLGEDIGRILSFLYTELRGCIVFAAEQRKADFTVLLELFVECYCICKDGENIAAQLKDSIYWYMSDYSDDFIEYRVREQLDPSLDFAVRIIMDSDLTDLRYLYRYGEYITENELRTAAFLNTLSQTEIEQMASTFTEGYRIGFELGNKDISKKKLVNIRYCIGFERLVREEIRQFEQMGLKTTIYRAAQHSINKRMHHKIGYYATSPNKQMDYDHRFDNALYLDAQFVERKLGPLRFAYEQHKEAAAVFGGPAVMEVFGENPFEPEDKKEALH